jgi:hypothetical protein
MLFSHEHKMCHNPSLGFITKAKGKCYVKWIEEQAETWDELAWVKRIPPRGGKSLVIKGKHPYLTPMVNSLVWELGFIKSLECLSVDFKG